MRADVARWKLSRRTLEELVQAWCTALEAVDPAEYAEAGERWRSTPAAGEGGRTDASAALQFWFDLGRDVAIGPASLSFDGALIFYCRVRGARAHEDQARLHAAAFDAAQTLGAGRWPGGARVVPAGWDVGRVEKRSDWLEIHVQLQITITQE